MALSGALHALPDLIPDELGVDRGWRASVNRALARMLDGPVLATVREELAT